jgi:hypothetical protein
MCEKININGVHRSAVRVLTQSMWQQRGGTVYITDDDLYCPQCGEQAMFYPLLFSSEVCEACATRAA